MPADTTALTEAREALAAFDAPCRARYVHGADAYGSDLVWTCGFRSGHDGEHGFGVRAHPDNVPHLRAALAEVARLSARVAELERERAGDVAGIVGWLRNAAARRAKAADDRGNTGSGMTAAIQYAELAIAADAIERGDWREGVLPADPRDAEIARLRGDLADAVAERDHAVLCYNIAVRPDLAGPAMLDEELPDEPTEAMRVRSLHLRTAFWTLGVLAQAHPDAVNHLAFVLTMPPSPEDAPPEMKGLEGWRLEVAAIKPDGKGPSQMRAEAVARIAALESAARAVLSLTGDEPMEEADAAWTALADAAGVPDGRST